MSLNGLEKAVLLSLSYSNIFSYPLKSEEVYLRLIDNKNVSLLKVKEALECLCAKKIIKKKSEYYFIGEIDLAETRRIRSKFTSIKLYEAQKFSRVVSKIPFVRAIVVTGSLSVNNAKENDDIDWLIITSNKSLWIVRPLLILFAHISNKRREKNGNHRDNSWCLNMFLTEESLFINKPQQSIYTAYEVCQAKFLYDAGGIEYNFLSINNWVRKYLNNFWKSRIEAVNNITIDKNRRSYQDNFIVDFFNKILFNLQYRYMEPSITREIVNLNKALFHPRDTKSKVINDWKNIINNVK